MLYKQRIKAVIEEQKKENRGFTLSKTAEKLEIEPSYLSRFLSDPNVHFSDDLLCRFLTELKLNCEKMDYIFLLKDFDRTDHPERKLFLKTKIKSHQLQQWRSDLLRFRSEIIDILCLMQKIDKP